MISSFNFLPGRTKSLDSLSENRISELSIRQVNFWKINFKNQYSQKNPIFSKLNIIQDDDRVFYIDGSYYISLTPVKETVYKLCILGFQIDYDINSKLYFLSVVFHLFSTSFFLSIFSISPVSLACSVSTSLTIFTNSRISISCLAMSSIRTAFFLLSSCILCLLSIVGRLASDWHLTDRDSVR